MDGPYGECVVRFLFLYCSEIWFCCIARTGLQPLVLVDFSVCLNSYNLHKLSVTVVFLAPLYLVLNSSGYSVNRQILSCVFLALHMILSVFPVAGVCRLTLEPAAVCWELEPRLTLLFVSAVLPTSVHPS